MINVIIPTYNRSKCIEETLTNSLANYNGNLFCFEIHDSSEDDVTEKLVCEFKAKHSTFPLLYRKYASTLKVDDKVTEAIKRSQEDYFYLCGDGVFVDYNELERVLKENQFSDFCLINVEEASRIGHRGQDKDAVINSIYPCSNNIEFIGKYFSHLTYWGASIISRHFFSEILQAGFVEKYTSRKNLWWLAAFLAEGIELRQRQGEACNAATIYLNCIGTNRFKGDHMWTKGEQYYYITFTLFNEAVDLLPDVYDEIKEKIIKFFRKDSLATRPYLLKLKKSGTITLGRTFKYKTEIQRVSGLYWYMIILCITPTFVMEWIYKLYMKVKWW